MSRTCGTVPIERTELLTGQLPWDGTLVLDERSAWCSTLVKAAAIFSAWRNLLCGSTRRSPVGFWDVDIVVQTSNGSRMGTLRISPGAIDWVPRRIARRLTKSDGRRSPLVCEMEDVRRSYEGRGNAQAIESSLLGRRFGSQRLSQLPDLETPRAGLAMTDSCRRSAESAGPHMLGARHS